VVGLQNGSPLAIVIDVASGKRRTLELKELNVQALGARRFSGTHVSPDGSLLAITADDGTVFGWSLAGGGAARVLAKLGANEAFVGWSNEPARILVATWTGPQARIEALDLGSGRRTAVREIAVEDPVGMLATPELFLSNDAQTYMYGTTRMLSTLYLVSGLSGAK
jgi:hypothetical protein